MATPTIEPASVDFIDLLDPDEHFCLRVQGDALTDEHIADGDVVIISPRNEAQDGEIAVVLLGGEDPGFAPRPLLRKVYREGLLVRLEAGNRTIEPTWSNKVEVLGVAVGVIRRVGEGVVVQ